MLNFQDVQREVGQQHANQWEELWYDLAVADGYRAGVPLDAIHWDYRTAAKDGGRDLVIDRGTPRSGAVFVPDRPSVWSVKSGANGVSAATLRAELSDTKHPKLVNLIRSGYVYIYCLSYPAGQDDRAALRTAADECCAAFRLGNDSIKLLFDNHLCDGLKMYPAVLKRHCPHLSRTKGQTLDQWGRPRPHFDTRVGYVNIADRRSRIDRLVSHLGATDEPPVLHVAGLSGIGKTRLVYEACRDVRVPPTIMYFESYLDCMELMQRLADDETLSVRFVVDEVSLDQHIDLRNKLHGFGNRVRAISIGPAGPRDESRDTIAILPPPDTTTGVLAVLKHHAPTTVPESGLEHIAEQCGHDLRFALLMVDAVQKDPALLANPGDLVRALSDTKSLYTHVLTLFSGGPGARLDGGFQDRYPWLTLGAHIGVKPPREVELSFVASRASCSLVDMERTVSQAIACGLGDRPAHLFEAVPRGMATRVFADVLWPMIEPRFKELLGAAPDPSFVRSIMQRVEMCPAAVKKEVTSSIDSHFRSALGPPSLAVLKEEGASRTLRSWAELSPEAGLPWLRLAIDAASVEELRALEGSGNAGWGPSGPRRDVVWLLEHLACFAEHFTLCEAMLFRLAVAENETIGNNATAVWIEKFRVLLSNTQAPYPDRVQLLMDRIALATSDTVQLLMRGFVESVTSPHSAMAPPPTVGGRLVPPEWRPVGMSIYDLFTKATVQGLRVVSGLSPTIQKTARGVIAANLTTFYKQDTHAELVKFFAGPLDTEERLALSAALEDLRDRLRDDSDPKVVTLAEAVSKWLEQVAPKDLAERTRLVVGRPPWSYDTPVGDGRDAWKQPYREIVSELRANVAVLRDLSEWLHKSSGEGLWSFGWMLATEGSKGEFDDVINEWLTSRRCLNICGGFLASLRSAQGVFPAWATLALDGLADSYPDVAAKMTIAIDPTATGWERVKKCVARDRPAVVQSLGRMFGTEWEAVLGPTGQAWILDQLWPESEPRDDIAGGTALHLFEMFRHQRKQESVPPALLPVARRLVFTPPDLRRGHNAHMWKDLALVLARTEPDSVIAYAAEVALDFRTYRGAGDGEAVGILQGLVGGHDQAIIVAVLDALQEMRYELPMEVQSFQKLFLAMNSEIVAAAVDAKGVTAARAIGEFIPDPGVAPDGTAALPAVTEWYMRTYGDDEECFRQFCIGRWNGRMQTGWAWQRQTEVDQLVKAYSSHPIPSLRRWAAVTNRDHEAEVERHRIEFEEDKRR